MSRRSPYTAAACPIPTVEHNAVVELLPVFVMVACGGFDDHYQSNLGLGAFTECFLLYAGTGHLVCRVHVPFDGVLSPPMLRCLPSDKKPVATGKTTHNLWRGS